MTHRTGRLKAGLKAILDRLGLHVLRTLPRGVSVAHDVRRAMPATRFDLIFDVGANVGQSAQRFLRDFPEARIVCFEPSSRHHAQLANAFGGRAGRVACERLALGSVEGWGTLIETADPTMYHLKNGRAGAPEIASTGFERVAISTVDRYCEKHGVELVDFLKIDTEGHDYEVIVGADEMISDERIGLLQCECSMNPENSFHVGFAAMCSHLELKGYRLFGIYEQVHEWITDAPNLRRVNAVFVSPRIARSGRRASGPARATAFVSPRSETADVRPARRR